MAAVDPDNLLLGLEDGSFSEQGGAAGLALARRGRGAVVVDFNLDGMLDLLVVNREEPVSLFRSIGAGLDDEPDGLGNYLAIKLQNGPTNPDAIGAVVEITTGSVVQTRTVHIGGGHASGQVGWVHFGLGDAQVAQVRIRWPGIEWSQHYSANANSFVSIGNGAGSVEYLSFSQ